MTAARGLAVLRIGLGLEFAGWAWEKTSSGWLQNGSELAQLLAGYLPQAQPSYAVFLGSFVLPHVEVFAKLITLGEWTTAVALTLGLFTRAGSVVGMWLMVNFMLMRGLLDPSGSIDRVFFLICLVCFLASAGQVWGLDGMRKPASPPARNIWSNLPTAASVAEARSLAQRAR
jgi:uncharacterized membrane protein YphA (DoxX/SURF4 family)